ncbi:hypothetical protein [Alcaligenes sp. SDU_A2]|uniref:hypothetical protein n=1 Tax=Alcaligenes sp. SDU_A2 TaxID=3136634 RepID=UPI002C992797|nr:hypothetical protein [Alcaligenes faecalis]
MPAPFYYHLTLGQRHYRIQARPGCSRLAVLEASRPNILGAYEPRWLGSSCRGGYWAAFHDEIDSQLLLNMDAIARLIDSHRLARPDTELDADLDTVLNLHGRLRTLPGLERRAA